MNITKLTTLTCGLSVSLCFNLLVAREANAITLIADTRGAFSSFNGGPALNDKGTIAFSASLDAGGSGIFTSSGGSLTTIANTSGYFANAKFNSTPAINNQGTVAFTTSLNALYGIGDSLFTSSGGSLTTIGISTNVYTLYSSPDINDEGTVAFTFGEGLRSENVFTSSDGSLTQISSNFNYITAGPDINNQGTVAFAGAGPGGILTSSGGQVTSIVDVSNNPFNTFPNGLVINDEGTVAFGAELKTGELGIFTSSGGVFTSIADTSDPFSEFVDLAINNQGTVAFLAGLDEGGYGIFTGSDPIADKVIATGDSLLGSTVTSLESFGLNNSGEIAFSATLADGTQGIFRTEPVPEPVSALGLVMVVSAFGASSLHKRSQLSKRF